MLNSNETKKTNGSLVDKSVGGFAWLFTGSVFQAALRILVLAVLARLLNPNDFGVLGACMVIVSFSDTFSQMGVAPAIIQKKNLLGVDVSTGFVITVLLSVVMACLVFFLSPTLAALFKNDILVMPLKVLCFLFPLVAVGTISNALLERDLQFKQRALIDLASFVLGYSPVTILLAWLGYGYWALVFGFIAQASIKSVSAVLLGYRKLGFSVSTTSINHLLKFGAGITMARLANFVALNGDYFVVGRMLGILELGLYTRAYNLMQQPIKLIGTLGDQVLFPVLSTVQNDGERVSRAFLLCNLIVFSVCAPGCAALYFVVPDLVAIVLGSQWLSVVDPLQILLVGLPFRIAYKFNDTVLRASGKTFLLAVTQWAYAIMILVFAYIGIYWNLKGVAIGVSLAITLNYILGIFVVRKIYPINAYRFAYSILKWFLISLTVALLVYVLIQIPFIADSGAIVRLFLGGLVFSVAFGAVFIILPALFGEEGTWIKTLFLKKLQKRS